MTVNQYLLKNASTTEIPEQLDPVQEHSPGGQHQACPPPRSDVAVIHWPHDLLTMLTGVLNAFSLLTLAAPPF
jgi:hypothetical protein